MNNATYHHPIVDGTVFIHLNLKLLFQLFDFLFDYCSSIPSSDFNGRRTILRPSLTDPQKAFI